MNGGDEVETLSPLYWRLSLRTAAEKDVTKNIDGLIQNIGCELSLSYPLLFIGLMVDDSGRQSRAAVVAGAFKGDEADTAEEENYDFLYAS
ncbi:unnamed protein product [Brassica rapa]|uniref:Uncharacterized protein n=1 Tax=Brassica campestris TaxID=3711 RepID=A0A8D9HLW3_BRACM|nr:unnamed protein product [Brassica rapa]